MKTIYDAILHEDGTLEWEGEAPHVNGEALKLKITILDEAPLTDEERGRRIGAALEKLAASNPFAGIDPVEWQREIRRDRPLPGREEAA